MLPIRTRTKQSLRTEAEVPASRGGTYRQSAYRVSSVILMICALMTVIAIPGALRAFGQTRDWTLTKSTAGSQGQANSLERVLDRIIAREKENLRILEQYTPMVETYIQDYRADKEQDITPIGDHYFLGRASFKGAVRDDSYLRADKTRFFTALFRRLSAIRTRGEFVPLGFAQMAVIDGTGFDREHYEFKLADREFLGELRCLVFDVTPKGNSGKGRFVGRIWAEDQGYNIVRANGVFNAERSHNPYLHFDMWRLNLQPDLWLPVLIFTEEVNARHVGVPGTTAFRAQTRLWGYKTRERELQEFTQMVVDTSDEIKDQSESPRDLSPIAAERAWQRLAEDNVVNRLQRAGLLAPPGETEKVLQTVVNNLLITNNLTLDPEVRCRILLTTPVESFSVGHTIVLSRGLLDVLPDEATLAYVLAHELGYIVLDHRMERKFAYADRTMFADEQTLRRLSMMRTPAEEQAADEKGIELLQKSPYGSGLAPVGLFLQQVQHSQKVLRNLISARMGNTVFADPKSSGVATVTAAAPGLERRNMTQIAALPLGGRIKVDAWTGQVEISKARPVPLLTPRENKPFEITPMLPHLMRYSPETKNAAAPAKGRSTSGAQ